MSLLFLIYLVHSIHSPKSHSDIVPSCFSHAPLFATVLTLALQAPLSMGFFRQEYWSRLPCPPPGYLPNPGIQPTSLRSLALAGRFFTTSATWKAQLRYSSSKKFSLLPHLPTDSISFSSVSINDFRRSNGKTQILCFSFTHFFLILANH